MYLMEQQDKVLTPELENIAQQIITSSNTPPVDKSQGLSDTSSIKYAPKESFFSNYLPQDNRPTMQVYRNDVDQAYTKMPDGTYRARYENYTYGQDNDTLEANRQSFNEKLTNGLTKFGGKVGTAVAGATVGTVYGLGAMIADGGKLSSFSDNTFKNWLYDLDVKLDSNFAHYYTKQEREAGVFGQMASVSFWSDKVLGGLAFTAGTVISEGIWAYATGGISLAASPFRWAVKGIGATRVAQGVAGMKNVLKALPKSAVMASTSTASTVNWANRIGRVGDVANLGRFVLTSAGHEASVEALQFRREQEELFYDNFRQVNGREPDAEETSEFYENLESAANGVFLTNMAIVGSSNLLTLGNIFKIKTPSLGGVGRAYNRTMYGIGREAADVSKKQMFNRATMPYIKAMATEGLYEEGSQSITSSTAGKWLQHTYKPEAVGEAFDIFSSIADDFAHQYGSEEGWKENMVGMIIGVIGEGAMGNNRNEIKKEVKDALSRTSIQNTYTPTVVANAFLNANRISSFSKEAEAAQEQGKIVEAQIAQDGVIASMLTNKNALGESKKDVLSDVKTSLETVTQEQLDSMGIDADVNTWREQQMQAFSEVANSFYRNREFAERVVGKGAMVDTKSLDSSNLLSGVVATDTREVTIQSLTFSLMAGERAYKTLDNATKQLTEIVGTENSNALESIQKLSFLSATDRVAIDSMSDSIKATRDEIQQLNKQLQTLDNANPTEGDTATGDRIIALSDKVRQLQADLSQREMELQERLDAISNNTSVVNALTNIETDQVRDFSSMTVEDFINLNNNLDKLATAVETLKRTNPSAASQVEALLEEYNQAKNAFKNYQKTIIMLSSGEFNIPTANTRLGKYLKRNKTLDEANRDWLSDILKDYTGRVVETLGTLSEMSAVEESTIESIGDKMLQNIPLTEKEMEFYNDNKEDIDDYAALTPAPPASVTPPPVPQTREEFIQESLERLLNRIDEEARPVDPLLSQTTPPTKEVIDEYEDLLYREFSGATQEELDRKEEIEVELRKWKVFASFVDVDSGMTLADLVELHFQINQAVGEQETLVEPKEEDIKVALDTGEGSGTKVDYNWSNNPQAPATVKQRKDGSITLNHLDPNNIITTSYNVVRGGKAIGQAEIQPGDTVILDSGETLRVTPSRGIVFASQADFQRVLPNFVIVNAGMTSWSYSDVYYNNGSEIVRVESDSTDDITLAPEHIPNVHVGDEVTLEIDRNDPYTKKILDAYTNRPNDKTRKELTDNLKIYVVHNGKRVGVLKGQRNEYDKNFADIREEAFQMLTGDEFRTALNISVSVDRVFIGTPTLSITTDSKLNVLPITESGAKNVVATGYILDGNVVTSKSLPNEVDRTYVAKLSNRNKGRKVPVAVVKKGSRYIAIPLKMTSSNILAERANQEVDSALTPDNAQTAKNLNMLIQKYSLRGIAKFIPNEVTPDRVQEVRDALLKFQTYTTADTLADKNYNVMNLQADAQTYIDLDNINSSVTGGKVSVDIGKAVFGKQAFHDYNNNKVSVENEMSNLLVELDSDIRDNIENYKDSKGNVSEQPYIEVFDNSDIALNPKSHLEVLRNVKILREAFKANPRGIVAKAIGKNRIDKAKTLIATLDRIEAQVKAQKEMLKSGQKNTACPV